MADLLEVQNNSSYKSLAPGTTLGFLTQILDINNRPFYYSGLCYSSATWAFKPKKVINERGLIDYKIKMRKNESVFSYMNLRCDGLKSKIVKIPNTDLSHFITYIPECVNYNSVQGNPLFLIYIKLDEIKPRIEDIAKNQFTTADKVLSSSYMLTRLIPDLKRMPMIQDKIFAIIRNNVKIPFLKEWIDYLLSHSNAVSFQLCRGTYADFNDPNNLYAFSITVNEDRIRREICDALSQGLLRLNNSNDISQTFAEGKITDLTSYLQHFSNHLIDKATKRFAPIFNPGTDSFTSKEQNYFDYAADLSKMKFFNTQKNVMTAVSRSLNKQKSALIVGEMGQYHGRLRKKLLRA